MLSLSHFSPVTVTLAPHDVGGFLLAGNDEAGRYVQPSTQDDLASVVSLEAHRVMSVSPRLM